MGIHKYLCLAKMLGVGEEQVTLHHAVWISQISHRPGSPARGEGFPCCLCGFREALLAGKPEPCFWSSDTSGEILHMTLTRCQHFLSLGSRGL